MKIIALICLILMLSFVVSAQAPLNNNNTVILNLGSKVATDTISTVSEVISSISTVEILTAKVQMMQDLAGIATGKMVVVGSVGTNVILQPATGTPVPD